MVVAYASIGHIQLNNDIDNHKVVSIKVNKFFKILALEVLIGIIPTTIITLIKKINSLRR